MNSHPKRTKKAVVSWTNIDESLKADEVLLKVQRVGICGTDMHAFRGKQSFFSWWTGLKNC